MTRAIVESGTILEGTASEGGIPVRIIREGKGSTATYTRAFLESNAQVFANRPMYISHPEDPSQPWKRNVDHIAGRTGKVVEYKIVDGVAGLYSTLTPREKYRDLVEDFGDLFGVSVYAPDSVGDEDDSGDYIVESVPDSPLISVDLVPAAGAGGRIEALIESIAAIEQTKPGVTSASQEKEEMENNKEIVEAFNALKSLVESLIAKLDGNVQAEAQAKVDAEAITSAVAEALAEFDSKRKVIEETELLPAQRESLIEAAKRGDDISPLIEKEKKVFNEAKSLTETFTEGRSFGGGKVESAVELGKVL